MNTLTKAALFATSVLALTACTDRMSVAEQKMAEIRSQPAAPVAPLPVPELVEDFVYSASHLRSPFVPPSVLTMAAEAPEQSDVKPDLERVREPLEEFELAELVYRGRVVAPDGEIYGLIQLPSGYIQEVKIGQYIGKSDGRILEITPTQINIEEIIPDARLGFVNKPAALITP